VGRYLPRELRIKLYNDVVALRRGGLTYRAIIGEVWRRYGARISKSHIATGCVGYIAHTTEEGYPR
jgi:intein-encoded DNA endonuclease-like protein